jgi:hypothetical protein
MITTFADDSRDKFFLDIFRQGEQLRPWDPNHIEWDDERYNRALAPVTGLSAPSPAGAMTTRIDKKVSAVRVAEHVFVPAERLFYQRVGGELRPDATAVMARQLDNLRKKVMRTVEYLCASTLLGAVVINEKNVPGSTVQETIKWPVTAYKSAAAWSDPNTLIASKEIKLLVDTYRKAVNNVPTFALLNSATEAYLLANAEIQKLCVHNPLYAASILFNDSRSTQVLNGLRLGNLEWQKHVGGYTPDRGAFTDFMPPDKLILLPQALADTIALAECSAAVPSQLWGNAAAVGIDLMPPGFAAYTEVTSDPVGIKLIAVWIGVPVLKFPEAVMVAQVA